jgi:hypothetical protein
MARRSKRKTPIPSTTLALIDILFGSFAAVIGLIVIFAVYLKDKPQVNPTSFVYLRAELSSNNINPEDVKRIHLGYKLTPHGKLKHRWQKWQGNETMNKNALFDCPSNSKNCLTRSKMVTHKQENKPKSAFALLVLENVQEEKYTIELTIDSFPYHLLQKEGTLFTLIYHVHQPKSNQPSEPLEKEFKAYELYKLFTQGKNILDTRDIIVKR